MPTKDDSPIGDERLLVEKHDRSAGQSGIRAVLQWFLMVGLVGGIFQVLNEVGLWGGHG